MNFDSDRRLVLGRRFCYNTRVLSVKPSGEVRSLIITAANISFRQVQRVVLLFAEADSL